MLRNMLDIVFIPLKFCYFHKRILCKNIALVNITHESQRHHVNSLPSGYMGRVRLLTPVRAPNAIASDHRERGNLTVVVLNDCKIASASSRNDPRGDFLGNDGAAGIPAIRHSSGLLPTQPSRFWPGCGVGLRHTLSARRCGRRAVAGERRGVGASGTGRYGGC